MHLFEQDKFPYHTVGTTTAIILGHETPKLTCTPPFNFQNTKYKYTQNAMNSNENMQHTTRAPKRLKPGQQKTETTYTCSDCKTKR